MTKTHAQTSNNYIRDKCILAGIMGITPCITIIMISTRITLYNAYTPVCLPYLLYASCIFIFSLLGKIDKTHVLLKYFYIAIPLLFLLGSITTPILYGVSVPFITNGLTLKILIIFCCTQLIPLKYEQVSTPATSIPLQNSMKKGMIMLAFRFIYFALIAEGISIIWMRGWY